MLQSTNNLINRANLINPLAHRSPPRGKSYDSCSRKLACSISVFCTLSFSLSFSLSHFISSSLISLPFPSILLPTLVHLQLVSPSAIEPCPVGCNENWLSRENERKSGGDRVYRCRDPVSTFRFRPTRTVVFRCFIRFSPFPLFRGALPRASSNFPRDW